MSRNSFDKIAFFYDFVERYILKDYQGSIDLISEFLPKEERSLIIDIGGGTGFFSEHLSNNEVTAVVVDPSRNMLKKVKNNHSVQADATTLALKDETFDLAIIINVLHHVAPNSQKKILSEVYRILKSGGTLFIIEVFFPHSFWNSLFARFENFLVGKTYHMKPADLVNQLDSEKFLYVKLHLPEKHTWKYVVIGKKG